MGGDKNPKYFHQALSRLESILPHAKTKIFQGLDHAAPNVHAPEKIAQALQDYFRKFS